MADFPSVLVGLCHSIRSPLVLRLSIAFWFWLFERWGSRHFPGYSHSCVCVCVCVHFSFPLCRCGISVHFSHIFTPARRWLHVREYVCLVKWKLAFFVVACNSFFMSPALSAPLSPGFALRLSVILLEITFSHPLMRWFMPFSPSFANYNVVNTFNNEMSHSR